MLCSLEDMLVTVSFVLCCFSLPPSEVITILAVADSHMLLIPVLAAIKPVKGIRSKCNGGRLARCLCEAGMCSM